MQVTEVAPKVTALSSTVDVPMYGTLAINAFFLSDGEPTLVDTGMFPDRTEFLAAVRSLVDLDDLRWIWLTHADRDHTGALTDLLEQAPNARVVTTFYSVGTAGLGNQPIPPERAYLVRDGSRDVIGGREITAIRPPLFDNPGTVGFLDHASGIFFSSDFLGAVLPSADQALADDVDAVAAGDLAAGALTWGSFDAPWIHTAAPSLFEQSLLAIRDLQPQMVLSTHLPPVRKNLDVHLDRLRALPTTTATAMPDQAVLEAALAGMPQQPDAAGAEV